MADSLEELVARGRDGDREALERLVLAIQDRVYALALRMLWHTFERFGEELDEGLSEAASSPPGVERALLLEEVKIGCTLALLTCLDRPHRLAYILGEILEMDGVEAAEVLETDAATYRKRLERARADVIAFTPAKCGLVEPERRCRCRLAVLTSRCRRRVRTDLLTCEDARWSVERAGRPDLATSAGDDLRSQDDVVDGVLGEPDLRAVERHLPPADQDAVGPRPETGKVVPPVVRGQGPAAVLTLPLHHHPDRGGRAARARDDGAPDAVRRLLSEARGGAEAREQCQDEAGEQ